MTQSRRAGEAHPVFKLGLLFLMYVSQKVFLTFSWTLLPMVLRRQDISLGAIGFMAIVYSPWALKFVHASLVDRYYSGRLGKRKSWIVPFFCLSWIILPFLAILSPTDHLIWVLFAVFILNFLFATIDIAVDGYATDILTPEERPWGNTIQMVGYLFGYMMGAGIFLIVYQRLGWMQTLFLIAATQLVLMLPAILHKEIAPVSIGTIPAGAHSVDAAKPSIWLLLKQPQARWFVLFLAVITIFDQGGNQLRLPLFADLGVTPAQLGRMNIWIGTPVSMMGAFSGGLLIRRLGVRQVFALGCLGAATVSLLSACLSTATAPCLWHVQAVLGLDKLVIGIITVLAYSMTMTMSAGPQAATNYAVLSSTSHLIGFTTMPIVGHICDRVGYFALFGGLALGAFLSIFIGDYLLRRRLIYPEVA